MPRALREMKGVPYETAYLWSWYEDLTAARTAGFNLNSITWSDIHAYFALRGIAPQTWEVDTIRAIDQAYLVSRSDKVEATASDASSIMAYRESKRAKK